MEQKIINMTPHDVVILNSQNQVIKVYPKGPDDLRLPILSIENVAVIDGCLITETKFGKPENLPDEEPGTYYIVSQMIKNKLSHRKDLLVPTDVQRNANNSIMGARALGI